VSSHPGNWVELFFFLSKNKRKESLSEVIEDTSEVFIVSWDQVTRQWQPLISAKVGI
jgi:hypothetical protein